MKALKQLVMVVALVVVSSNVSGGGLYSDEEKNVTGGDLKDQDYWWAKFDDMMLDLAVKQHQPEGRIGMNLISSVKRLEELEKKYPKHEGIKKWKQHAEDVKSKLDPNADRGKSFGPECPWDEANFAQLWVNFHTSQMDWEARDYNAAKLYLQNVMQNLEIMLKPDRMKDYPEDLRKWVVDSKPKAELLNAQVKYKLHEGPAPPAAAHSSTEPSTTRPSSGNEKSISKDDLKDQDYWWAKFDAMMLELAIKEHQPEGRISVDLASSIRRLDDLLKKYPDNANLKKWKERADAVQEKIDPNANRSESFTPECPWDESNFAQLWVNFHAAQVAWEAKDRDLALPWMQNVMQNYEIMMKPERMKDYPDDLRQWVVDNKPEAEKLYKEVKGKRGR